MKTIRETYVSREIIREGHNPILAALRINLARDLNASIDLYAHLHHRVHDVQVFTVDEGHPLSGVPLSSDTGYNQRPGAGDHI